MGKNQAIKAIIVILVLLAIGVGIIVSNKFQFSINYSPNIRVEVYLGKSFEIEDVLAITNSVYENQEVLVQKGGAFQDEIAITVRSTTDEQNEELIHQINEKYETELTVEDIDIHSSSNVRGRDIVRPYIWVSLVAGVLILLFFGVRYRKLGIGRAVGSVVAIAAGTQILYLTLISICGVQINSMTIGSGLAILIFCFMYLIANYEKALK